MPNICVLLIYFLTTFVYVLATEVATKVADYLVKLFM